MRFLRTIGVIGIAAALAALAPAPADEGAGPSAGPYAAAAPLTAEPDLPTPLWFDQNPRLIRADHAGGLSLDDFLVAGDVPTLTFDRLSLSAADSGYVVRETWQRTGTTAIGGHLISVFRPSWDNAALWDAIGWQRRGFDHPYVRLGWLLVAGAADAAPGGGARRFPIRLRTAPLNVPAAEVAQIDAQTQYASHVVNLVMPEFGDRRLAQGDYGHELADAARRFYAHFSDEYASIAFIPRQQHVVPYDAFHHNVRNPIAGLGALPVFDDTAAYGSAGVLRSVELYPNASFTSNASSTHAISHQWVDYWDWSALAGIDRAGRDPESHTPLLYPGEAYAGAVLDVTRRPAAGGGGTFVVERTPAPARLHPTTLYRMGLIGPEAVPELLVFENQGQFDETRAAAPSAGTAIEGSWRRVHVNDILARHGLRSGPVDDAWSRVSVVVSRDGLLSAEEMSYWNFFAARHEATAGTTTWEGVPSFFEATGRAARLTTDVTPLTADKIVGTVEAGDMPVATGEFRDVELDAPVPARIAVGETVTIAGAVTATERDDFIVACANWDRYDADEADGTIFKCSSIAGDRFSISYTFTHRDAGRHTLRLFLYTDSGRQFPRASISGISVAFGQAAPEWGVRPRARPRRR